ncbi:uncharacterized protein DS421_19g661310 [Arachis hypogaea]|uniref:Ubiquitin-like protease family profile domain-containing protein n=1 Tax=Arachis hypogaea TaxID=3818 RepID=A0A6B9VCR5_ARAHY|nr:uncharacterized protein DS421_19g661310 [Arachis hypogaea]
MAARNQPGRNQTKDLKCATHLLSDKFRNMSEEKKTIVRDLGFGGLMHIPPLRVHHQMLRELANNFKLGENRLEIGYGSFKITPRKIGHALGINATGNLFPQKVDYKKLSEDDKVIFRRFQGKTLKSLTDEMMDIGVGNEEDRLMFKRIFILYIQMAFLLPTTINKISHVHLAPIFEMDSITERNWGGHVLTFIVKGITDYKEKKKKAIDGCLFALMIIYFHLSKNKGKKRAERPPKSWIANWSKEQLVERMNAETEEILEIVKMAQTREKMKKIEKKEKKNKKRKASSTSSSEQETTDSDSSTSESETQEDSEDSPRKQPSKKRKKSEESSPVEKQRKKKKTQRTPKNDIYEIGSEDLDELLRENNEKSAAEREKEADMRSTEGRYVSSETIPDMNLGSDDPSSQGHTEQSSVNRPAESMLSLVQESASEPADSNIMVVREETPSEALAIVPIQVFVPVSQTTTVPEFEETPETDFEPTPLLQIEGTTKTYPAEEDTAALMMMARTASYVPKTDPMPSFSLGFTDSSQEKAATQEGASTQKADRAKTPETANLLEQLEDLVQKIASSAAKEESKSPQIQKETGRESSGKFETPVGINQNTGDMKEKCYLWATRVKTYADDSTNEFDNLCTLIAQDKYILNRIHLASLQAGSYIESEVSRTSILSPPDIVSMAVSKHPNGEFISPKTNKEFKVEDYPMFIPFIDGKKLASHRYIFAPVCYSGHWWLWVIDTTKGRFYILDPLHKKSPSDERKQLNKFIGYVISRIRAYTGGAPLKKKENELEIKATYVKISGQKSIYDCAIYVMKWLELIEPENIKRAKYEWDNWPQEEVDHYRVEYASRVLFSEMNKERDQAIRASNAIRLSKPSSVLLSPLCQINSTDIETE